MRILYEDNHLIAVFKPAGLLVQGDITGQKSLMDYAKEYLKKKYNKKGNVFLGLLHRLDRPVSGIVLFSKTSKGASRISEQFRERKVEKIYHAVVLGKPKTSKGNVKSYLGKENKKAIVSGQGKLAELSYEVLKSNERYSLLKIKIKSGRFHQIRAQLASLDCPVLGDVKYGAKDPLNDRSIALSATGLSFKKAVGEERVTLSIDIPNDWKKWIFKEKNGNLN